MSLTFVVCGNCDIDGCIPDGYTSDDCICCKGIGWLALKPDGSFYTKPLEECQEFLDFIRRRHTNADVNPQAPDHL